MPFPNHLFAPSTWRILGLGLATTIAALGTGSLISPLRAADGLGVTPQSEDGRSMVAKTMIFLGARDLCLASSLFWFDYLGSQKAMGVITTSAIVIYVLDIWIAAQGPRGWDAGVWGLTIAGSIASFVGVGLVQCKK